MLLRPGHIAPRGPELRQRIDATRYSRFREYKPAATIAGWRCRERGDGGVSRAIHAKRSLDHDEQMGARPLARVIQEHIKKPLADEVLFGQLEGGGHVRVVLVKD